MTLRIYTGSGNWENVDMRKKYFYAYQCGAGTSCFVEPTEFVEATEKNLIFKAKISGTKFRTQRDSFNTVGKALNNRVFLMVRDTPIDYETSKDKILSVLYIK